MVLRLAFVAVLFAVFAVGFGALVNHDSGQPSAFYVAMNNAFSNGGGGNMQNNGG